MRTVPVRIGGGGGVGGGGVATPVTTGARRRGLVDASPMDRTPAGPMMVHGGGGSTPRGGGGGGGGGPDSPMYNNNEQPQFGGPQYEGRGFAVTVKFIGSAPMGSVQAIQSYNFDFAPTATVAELERCVNDAVVDHYGAGGGGGGGGGGGERGPRGRSWVPLYPPGLKGVSAEHPGWTRSKQSNLAEVLGCRVTVNDDGSRHVYQQYVEVGVIEAGKGAATLMPPPGAAAPAMLRASPIKTRRRRSHNQPSLANGDTECVVLRAPRRAPPRPAAPPWVLCKRTPCAQCG